MSAVGVKVAPEVALERKTQFFPIREEFTDYVNVPADKFRGKRKVLVSLDFLRQLIGLAAAATCFDEKFYRERHADLKKALEDGSIGNAREHFITEGFFEGRHGSLKQASMVDEKWYLSEYPDVDAAFKAGKIDSATEHYLSMGRKEGRRPSPDVSPEILKLIAAMHLTDSD